MHSSHLPHLPELSLVLTSISSFSLKLSGMIDLMPYQTAFLLKLITLSWYPDEFLLWVRISHSSGSYPYFTPGSQPGCAYVCTCCLYCFCYSSTVSPLWLQKILHRWVCCTSIVSNNTESLFQLELEQWDFKLMNLIYYPTECSTCSGLSLPWVWHYCQQRWNIYITS